MRTNGCFLMMIVIFSLVQKASAYDWYFGLAAKGAINKYRNFAPERRGHSVNTKPTQAYGLMTGVILSPHFQIDATVLTTKTFYEVNYTEGNSRFISADLHLNEYNLSGEYILSPARDGSRLYISAGVQLLQRLWGTEVFRNFIAENTYWPQFMISGQVAGGIQWLSRHTIGKLYAGIRLSGNKTLVYNLPMNQVFTGISLGFMIHGKKTNRYQDCFRNF